jgi:hypothetical protein
LALMQVGDPDCPDWQPDVVVSEAGGKVFIYRQVMKPWIADATLSSPLPMEGRTYKVTVFLTLRTDISSPAPSRPRFLRSPGQTFSLRHLTKEEVR